MPRRASKIKCRGLERETEKSAQVIDRKEFYLCGEPATRNHTARWRRRWRGTVTVTEGVALISAMQVSKYMVYRKVTEEEITRGTSVCLSSTLFTASIRCRRSDGLRIDLGKCLGEIVRVGWLRCDRSDEQDENIPKFALFLTPLLVCLFITAE